MSRLQFNGKAINQYKTKNGTIMRTYALSGKTVDIEAYKALMCAKTGKTEWPCDDTSKLPLFFLNVTQQKANGNYYGGSIRVIQGFANEDQFFPDDSASQIAGDAEMPDLIRQEQAKLQARINLGLERPARVAANVPAKTNNEPAITTHVEPKTEEVNEQIEGNNGVEEGVDITAGALNNG